MRKLQSFKRHLVPALILSVVAAFGFGDASAQDYPIENGAITTCTGIFSDDGLGTEGAYAPGMSYTFTICPDNPGDAVQVEFPAFSLYQSPNPNNSDYLNVFDGDNTSANSLGSYTGSSIQGLAITATINNPSGCLTFTFSSNPNGGGTHPGWVGLISCTTPCAPPNAAYEFVDPVPDAPELQTIGICVGDAVTFGDAGSTAGPGFSLDEYIWNFNDGTSDTLDGPSNVTHVFEEPGEYLVNLMVVDNNGCQNLNISPLQVLVSTIPIFGTEFNSPICLGSPASIDGDPVQSVTWTALPPQVVAGELFLPDGSGFSYTSYLTFDFFETDAVLENCSDFESLIVNMEHSWLGDLSFSIECPNGTSVTLLSYPNGGGGTYLGEAVDNEDPEFSGTPGVGYDYGWSPTSTNGYITDDDNATVITYTDNLGELETNAIVNPGIYQSEEDLCALVGCPLNGEWAFTVTDNIGLDNGYIFAWGINFNPALFPDVTTFTPIIGLGPDSTYWEGPHISGTSENGNTIDIAPPSAGFYDYTFFATNNFGCTNDTTVTVEVIDGPDIDAGPDVFVCNDPVTLMPGLADVEGSCSGSEGTYEYCYEDNSPLIVTYCPDNPGDGVSFMQIFIESGSTENFFDEFYVYDGDDITAPLLAGPLYGDLSNLSFQATNATGCITFQIDPDYSNSCDSGSHTPLVVTTSCQGGGNMVWSWSPPTGLSNPNIQNPSAFVEQSTLYTVSAYPAGMPGCVKTDQIIVAPELDADPGISTDTTLCYNSPTAILTDYLDGTPALGGEWTYTASGAPFGSTQFTPMEYTDGAIFNLTYTVTNGECTNSSNLTITILGVEDQSCCQTNANPGPDAYACALEYQLQAEPVVGTGTWTGPDNVTFSDIHDRNATVTAQSPGGVITLTWTDNNGFLCEVSNDITITFSDSLKVAAVTEDAVCYDECSGTAIAIATGGTSATGMYSYEWSGGTPGDINQLRDSLCAGIYSLKVTDNVGCSDSTVFTIGQPEPQLMTVTHSPPLCAGECNARVVIDAPTATTFSYDNGLTWSHDNIGFVCAGNDTVLARNDAGCSVRKSIHITNPPIFVADFNINPNPTTIENTLVTFQDVSRPGPIKSSQFDFFGSYKIGSAEDRISNFRFPRDTSGIYAVRLISESVNGCIDTVYKDLEIKDEMLWFIPNAFTPNGDGMNEVWKPVGYTMDPEDYELTIYDRFGQKIFHTKDIHEGWNGNVQGSEYFVPMGVYTYYIEVTSATTQEKKQITGFITLIR